MSFSAFSKDFNANMYTSVENLFITKYLPWADGDAVRVYLYGLYLCSCKDEFDAASAAKHLKLDLKRFLEIYGFWEECGLVQILSKDPFFVEYFPVNGAVGKPKPIHAEKYAEFNRELLRILQKAGKEFKPYELSKLLEFLETTQMEQQAFLLVTEYCVKKDGERFSYPHVMNKAKKLVSEHKYTYEQVSKDLADFNLHERELSKIFSLLGIFRKPQESDYDSFNTWLEWGMEPETIFECAKALKKGSLPALDQLLRELQEKNILTPEETREYLAHREILAKVVYSVARKLGVKIQNPRAYMEEYAEKWVGRGYEIESLMLIAGLCFKLFYSFPEMDSLLDNLYAQGIVDELGVKEYCSAREEQYRLLQKVQSTCGIVKKTQGSLDMIAAFQSWNFSNEMILEAAKRSAGATAPLAYMNKLLSEWKRLGVFRPEAIPEKEMYFKPEPRKEYKSEAAIAADSRSDREHYYAVLHENALQAAENARQTASKSEKFRLADSAVRKGEIELAKAEVYTPAAALEIRVRLESARKSREQALRELGLSDEDFIPKFKCKNCSDTGFLPDGRPCNCYPG